MSPSPADLYQQTVDQAKSNLGTVEWVAIGIMALVAVLALKRYK